MTSIRVHLPSTAQCACPHPSLLLVSRHINNVCAKARDPEKAKEAESAEIQNHVGYFEKPSPAHQVIICN